MANIRSFRALEVYEAATGGAMEIFERTKEFLKAETYSMVDQIRRSSRSACANPGEA
jgi:four helix bundle protein